MNITVMLFAVVAITIGCSWLLNGISRLARSFGVSQLIVGLTVVTLVTAGPELLVGVNAAVADADGIILGTVTGANIANIGLILGLGGLLAGGLPISTGLVRRGIPAMIIVAVVLYGLVWLEALNQVTGTVLVVVFVALTIAIVWLLRRDAAVRQLTTAEMKRVSLIQTQETLLADDVALLQERGARVYRSFEIIRMVAGIVLLLLGADALVTGALEIATQLDVNEVAVGATVVALATSLPEFVAVLLATRNKQPDVALGNIIGSSIANLLLVIGVASLVNPLWIDRRALWYEFPVMFALMLMLIPVVIDRKLAVWESAVYVGAYAAFTVGIAIL